MTRFDDAWFAGIRRRILRPRLDGEAARLRSRRTVRALALGSGRRDRAATHTVTERALAHLARRHASAVRAHMQLYRACLESTSLVPSDEVVQAAVQIEWLWYATPFKPFYRDHLAHVMKVTGLALDFFETNALGAPLAERTAAGLAEGSLGMAPLRETARRLGLDEPTLRRPEFWRPVLLEATRLASLLHDLDYPTLMSRKVARAAHPSGPSPHAPTLAALGGHLLAVPFAGELARRGLPREAQTAASVALEQSHSLPAGLRILELGRAADEVARLHPAEALVIEWAALAASLHDYDKLWEKDRSNAGLRPSFQRDPVSYAVALADQLQDFGRIHYAPAGEPGIEEAVLRMRRPVEAVEVGVAGDTLSVTWRFAAGASEGELQRKREDAEQNLRAWLDHRGLFERVEVEVTPG